MHLRNIHLDQLERFHLALTYGAKLPAEDVDYLFALLRSSDMVLVKASAFILVQLPKFHIQRLLKEFPKFRYKVRKTLILYLATTNFVEVFSFLLDLLVFTKNKDLIRTLVICLAGSEYMIFPLILIRLHTAKGTRLANLELLLVQMGYEKCAPYLAALPYIPHENVFRSIFGDHRIDRIKQ